MHGKKSILSGRSYSVWKIGTKACALVLVSSFLFSTGCKKKKEMEKEIKMDHAKKLAKEQEAK